MVDSVKVGTLTFTYEPDGDNPDVGVVVIESEYERRTLKITRDYWEWVMDLIQ